MDFDDVTTVKKEIGKEAFIRQLLIELAKNTDTPVDVVNAKIGEVRECIKEVLVCSVFVSGTCTASIGYDRSEPYTDYETYKEKVGDSYVTRQRAVTKYRTVTDWKPFNMDFSGKEVAITLNADVDDYYHRKLARTFTTISKSSFVTKGEAVVNKKALSRAISFCEREVENENVKLPGDKQKDKRCQCSTDVESIHCYKFPCYEVTFTYEGKDYSASAFACGDLWVHYDVPEKKTEETVDPVLEIEKEAKKKTRPLKLNSIIAWLIVIGALVVGAFACFVLKFCWIWPVVVIALVYAIISNKIYDDKYYDCQVELAVDYAKMKSQSQASQMQAKIKALNQTLKSYGYDTLSDSETPVIDGESDSVIVKNTPKIELPEGFTKKTVIGILLSIVLIISSLVVNHKFLHSPEHVEVNIVNKTVDFNPDEYQYGNYYIYFDYEIEAKKIGVDYVNVTVFVSDKEGNELGAITTTLTDMTVETGEKKIVTVSWSENQPEKNEFFNQLYNTDLDDLKFKYEIEHIGFVDGNDYYNPD